MNADLLLMKAQFEALRNYFTSLLPYIFRDVDDKDGMVWYAKFCLWKFEREILLPSSGLAHTSPETERIDRRRTQLQVLMDVAYIQGRLEEYGITRRIDGPSRCVADKVYEMSDHSEETMIETIDKLLPS